MSELPATVTIFGANDPAEGQVDYQQAYEVGKTLASLGLRVANGGYGGTMEASAKGAKAAGGKTVGVTCGIWKSVPNRYIDEVVKTARLWDRIDRLVELGSAGYVVLPGATGTLVELACVWELVSKGMMPARPIVCVGDFWKPLVEMMAEKRPSCAGLVAVINRPDELGVYFGDGGAGRR